MTVPDTTLDLLRADAIRSRAKVHQRDKTIRLQREHIARLTRRLEAIRAVCRPPAPLVLYGKEYPIDDPDKAGTLARLQAQVLAIAEDLRETGSAQQWERTTPAPLTPQWHVTQRVELLTMPMEMETLPMEVR